MPHCEATISCIFSSFIRRKKDINYLFWIKLENLPVGKLKKKNPLCSVSQRCPIFRTKLGKKLDFFLILQGRFGRKVRFFTKKTHLPPERILKIWAKSTFFHQKNSLTARENFQIGARSSCLKPAVVICPVIGPIPLISTFFWKNN